MVNTNGLDSKGIEEIQMLFIRANEQQLPAIMIMLEAEITKRNLFKQNNADYFLWNEEGRY